MAAETRRPSRGLPLRTFGRGCARHALSSPIALPVAGTVPYAGVTVGVPETCAGAVGRDRPRAVRVRARAGPIPLVQPVQGTLPCLRRAG